jgi:hypothetical protein
MTRQVPTTKVTTARIMASPEFALGLDDVRKGIPFDWRNGADDGTAWNYERGRLFGHIAPPNMPLRMGGRLNPKAIMLYDAASRRSLLI